MVRHQRAGLGAVVVAQRQPMQMLVDAHAQVVGDPLPDARGVVVVDVGCHAPMTAIRSVASPANSATPSVFRPMP